MTGPSGCPRRDDAAAWVLRALGDEEAAAYARHLEGCPICRAEVEELQWAVDRLPAAAPPASPPPELRDRTMAIVESEAAVMRAAGPAADAPPEPRPRPRRRLLLRPVALAAAACALALAGLGAGLLIGGTGGGTAVRTVAAQVRPPGAQARLVVGPDGRGRLLVDGLPSPGAGRVYEVWVVPQGRSTPVPAGALFGVDAEGRGAAAVPADLSDAAAVLVSSEPQGGSRQPSRAPLLQVRLA